ncbi:MAG TPA: PfkB family carbohydrate kinase [Pseudonocardia sp.]|nr:PfkB family carbohydrate kinase [Pseudonocardia sp.]
MRLVHLGNVLVDVVAAVPAIPPRGGDVLASRMGAMVGGGFNLMVAAVRHGAPVDYGGAHGTGPFGDLIRDALGRAGIRMLQPRRRPSDSGVVAVLVDGTGERTLISSPAAVTGPTADELAQVRPGAGDIVSITGYGLLEPASRTALLDWLPRLPSGVLVALDPGPLAPTAQPAALAAVVARADWVSTSAREAAEMTGVNDPVTAATALAGRTRRGALVRTGAAGCVLAEAGTAARVVPAHPVRPIDTTGAGDTHTGVLLAGLLAGRPAPVAARIANAAAAFAVTRPGPATAPTAAELDAFLATQG